MVSRRLIFFRRRIILIVQAIMSIFGVLIVLWFCGDTVFGRTDPILSSKLVLNKERSFGTSETQEILIADGGFHAQTLGSSSSNSSDFSYQQINTLYDFYNSTGGSNWLYNPSVDNGIPWNFTDIYLQNPCSPRWYGIECVSNDGIDCVVELNLQSSGLYGTIPTSISNLTALTYLFLNHNQLYGSIPNTIEYLHSLQHIILNNNTITGTLPSGLSKTNLTVLNIGTNQFQGTLPNSLGDLKYFSNFVFTANHFVGTLPASFGNTSLTQFDASYNSLTGTVPSELQTLTSLYYFDLYGNRFQGSLPDIFSHFPKLLFMGLGGNLFSGSVSDHTFCSNGNQSQLQYFELSNNSFTGYLPAAVGGCSNVLYVLFENNQFYGGIPTAFSQLSLLQTLDVSFNYMSGTFPSCVTSLQHLNTLVLMDNNFYGFIPEEIGNLTELSVFYGSRNYFSGSLPSRLFDLTKLFSLSLFGSYFWGTISSDISNLQALNSLYLSFNDFTGTLPIEFYTLVNLVYIEINDNHLSGSLSNNIAAMTQLSEFAAGYNLFTSTVPSVFTNFATFTSFSLNSNMFEGNIASFINPSVQTLLSTVDLSFNEFTNSIPSSLFKLPSLTELSLGSNCLQGSLPHSLCSAQKLTFLSLNGVSCSQGCRQNIAASYTGINTYTTKHNIGGTFPNCLFNLSNLITLQISGTSIYGTISDQLTIAPNLTTLTLSHNQLSGTIPFALQHHPFKTLDLAFNKFYGRLSRDDICSATTLQNQSLSLEVNRLSGEIPTCLQTAQNIDILSGNVFHCHYIDRSELPKNDEHRDNYQCASNSFDMAVYFWLIICFVFCVLVGVITRYCDINFYSSLSKHLQHCTPPFILAKFVGSLFVPTLNTSTWTGLTGQLHFVCQVSFFLSVFLFVLLVPLYGVLSLLFGAYLHSYAWQISSAFLASETAGIVLFVVWFALITVVLVKLIFTKHKMDWGIAKTNTTPQKLNFYHLQAFVVVLIDFIFVLLVNVGYVLTVVRTQNQAVAFLVEIAVALFKLVWNGACVPWLFKRLRQRTKQTVSLTFQVCIALFNNIIAPCAVIAVIHSNCFLYVVKTPPRIATQANPIPFEICFQVLLPNSTATSIDLCTSYISAVSTTYYQPPFTYSYQCTSALVQNYASVFVYMFLFDAFLKPVIFTVLRKLHRLYADNNAWSLVLVRMHAIHKTPSEKLLATTSAIFRYETLALHYVNIFAITLTFGVVFPPLVIIILVDVFMYSWYFQYCVELNLSEAKQKNIYLRYLDAVNAQCGDVVGMVRDSMYLVLLAASGFYGWFLIDTIGDETGWRDALWAPVTLVTWTLFLCVIYVYRAELPTKQESNRPTTLVTQRGSLLGSVSSRQDMNILSSMFATRDSSTRDSMQSNVEEQHDVDNPLRDVANNSKDMIELTDKLSFSARLSEKKS